MDKKSGFLAKIYRGVHILFFLSLEDKNIQNAFSKHLSSSSKDSAISIEVKSNLILYQKSKGNLKKSQWIQSAFRLFVFALSGQFSARQAKFWEHG